MEYLQAFSIIMLAITSGMVGVMIGMEIGWRNAKKKEQR